MLLQLFFICASYSSSFLFQLFKDATALNIKANIFNEKKKCLHVPFTLLDL